MKYNNVDIFVKHYDILNTLSAHACLKVLRMRSNETRREHLIPLSEKANTGGRAMNSNGANSLERFSPDGPP